MDLNLRIGSTGFTLDIDKSLSYPECFASIKIISSFLGAVFFPTLRFLYPKISILQHIFSQNEHFTTHFHPKMSILQLNFPQKSRSISWVPDPFPKYEKEQM